jgi:hypothetical protein
MSRITIFDRFGEEVQSGGVTEPKYEDFDMKNVLLHVDTAGSRPVLVSVFTAHNEPGGRSNRFYARFEGDRVESLFRDCYRKIEERTDELGWRLDTSSPNNRVETFTSLKNENSHPNIDDKDWKVFLHLLQQARLLDFGTRDVASSINILKTVVEELGIRGSFAISRNGRIPELSDTQLVLKPGEGGPGGFQPLGETERHMAGARANWEEECLEDAMTSIKDTVREKIRDVQNQTEYDQARIREELQRAVNSAFSEANQGLEVVTRSRLRSLEDENAELKRQRASSGTGVSSAVGPQRLKALAIVSVALLVVTAFVGGAVIGFPSLGGLPVVGQYLGGGGGFTWDTDPGYNASSGRLTLSGTAPPETDFVVVNIPEVTGDENASVALQVNPDGRFALDRRINTSDTDLTLTLTAVQEAETVSETYEVSTTGSGGEQNGSSDGATPAPTETPTPTPSPTETPAPSPTETPTPTPSPTETPAPSPNETPTPGAREAPSVGTKEAVGRDS